MSTRSHRTPWFRDPPAPLPNDPGDVHPEMRSPHIEVDTLHFWDHFPPEWRNALEQCAPPVGPVVDPDCRCGDYLYSQVFAAQGDLICARCGRLLAEKPKVRDEVVVRVVERRDEFHPSDDALFGGDKP